VIKPSINKKMKQLLLLLIAAWPLFSLAENLEIKGTYQGKTCM
jgi:hypothetical protein